MFSMGHDIAAKEAVLPLKTQSDHFLMLMRVDLNALADLYLVMDNLNFGLGNPRLLSM